MGRLSWCKPTVETLGLWWCVATRRRPAKNGGTPPRLVVLNIATLKSSRTLVSVAMSNQIEDDEIAADPETTPERNGAEIRDAWAKIAAEN